MKVVEIDAVSDFWYPPTYTALIDSFDVEVLMEVHDDGYDGDSRFLLKDGDRYGLLIFGWGSCSGCDALQACENPKDVTELRDQLWSEIHWEPTHEAMLGYITAKDWELDFAWHVRETRDFVEQAAQMLAD